MHPPQTIAATARRPAHTRLLWILTGLVLTLLAGRTFLPAVGVPLLLLAQVLFTLLHGARRYGRPAVTVFVVVTLVVSNALENLSILTGFPFGVYHYTMDPQVFLVPVFIGPAYVATGYLAWNVATVLVGEVRRGSGPLTVVGTPVVASFAMVAWDLAMDPTLATVRRLWIWENGGGFFGVPFVNFLGWSLTAYLFLQLFALYLRRRGPEREPAATATRVQALVLYAATALPFFLTYLIGERTTVTDAAGHTWRTADIYETSALTALYGMVFIALLAALTLARQVTNGADSRPAPRSSDGRRPR
ncbi:carotenoid biosynthesis protein [Nonomuraea soli]|uniref:Putative membrane protein n=1 Tax=Nonomuraea soli TaxID=1032476 RepID=A0A7W0HP93_9ACTN|nr:carotenoid biosynthesis protein [Nonomuraea soli]MBA2890336.1 putative membrane protein [Nonomuraea soli]